MLRSDLDAVHHLAKGVFRVPWARADFERELSRAWAVVRVLRPASGKDIVAFVNYWITGDEIQVMNVATDSAMRRQGFARALMTDVHRQGRARGSKLVVLEVRRSNEAALALYGGMGYERIGVRQAYYSDNKEDAVVMRMKLSG